MADPKRVARALQYQQDKPAWWDAVPVADAPGTVRAPTPQEMSWLDRLNELSAGAGKGIESQLEGYKNMVLHPVDTAQQMYQSGKAVVQDPSLLVKGLQAMGERAMGSPQGFGEVVGENINPRNLLRNFAKPSIEELTVYHGTPHRFPATERNPLGEFDASKIGTGEGAQAYGHGIYVAESPDVAKGYKQRLSSSSYSKNNALIDSGLIWHKAADAASEIGKLHPDNAGKISSQIMDWIDAGRKPETFLKFNAVSPKLKPAYEAALQEYAGAIKNRGNIYHVDLPDEMIDKMLDWDKPLSEQPKNVKDYFQKRGYTDKDWSAASFLKNEGDPDAVSSILREAGIPGIRYLDAGSRGAEKGTRNFVIFPGEEQNLKILERK